MERLFSFQDLAVWHKAVDFAEQVVRLVETMNTDRKHYRLIAQLESACTSVAMNIAEGKCRHSKKEFVQFLYIARGSLFETMTLLILFNKMQWIDDDKLRKTETMAEEITKMLNSLIKSIRNS